MTNELYALTDGAIVCCIGQKMKNARIAKNLTQAQVAERSGISPFSVSQLENGHNTNIKTVVMYLRSIERLDLLGTLTQEDAVNPLAIVDYQKKHPKRQRATGNKKPIIESEW